MTGVQAPVLIRRPKLNISLCRFATRRTIIPFPFSSHRSPRAFLNGDAFTVMDVLDVLGASINQIVVEESKEGFPASVSWLLFCVVFRCGCW